MTTPDTGTNVDLDTYVLRLHDPDPNNWILYGLVIALSDIDFLYKFSCEVNFEVHAVRPQDFEFVRSTYMQHVRESTAPKLAVLEARTGSLWIDLVEWVNVADVAFAGVAAYSLKCLVRILHDGPEKLVNWSTVVTDARIRRFTRKSELEKLESSLFLIREQQQSQLQRETLEQEALMLEARQRLIRLRNTMPDLEVSIINRDDERVVEPTYKIFGGDANSEGGGASTSS